MAGTRSLFRDLHSGKKICGVSKQVVRAYKQPYFDNQRVIKHQNLKEIFVEEPYDEWKRQTRTQIILKKELADACGDDVDQDEVFKYISNKSLSKAVRKNKFQGASIFA
ncbi:hypothetical protein CASFOL_023872 [Castilleja foliolosa]|uniref:Uncharacterized protein n=1 Tax=Castilleja foliolosa TaxID=1961234 RepID=A0ABD3CMN2_9LAMI